jgi:FAD:protein FMN transferase
VCRAPVALDLGGIAKGYAVDRAVDSLVAHGCSAGIVNAGGDLRAFGTHREKLLLRCPDGSFSPLEFADAALAVSDLDTEGRPSEHQGYYVRGKAASPHFRHAAVLANDAATADALVKCVLLCPREITNRLLRAFNATQVSANAAASES